MCSYVIRLMFGGASRMAGRLFQGGRPGRVAAGAPGCGVARVDRRRALCHSSWAYARWSWDDNQPRGLVAKRGRAEEPLAVFECAAQADAALAKDRGTGLTTARS